MQLYLSLKLAEARFHPRNKGTANKQDNDEAADKIQNLSLITIMPLRSQVGSGMVIKQYSKVFMLVALTYWRE